MNIKLRLTIGLFLIGLFLMGLCGIGPGAWADEGSRQGEPTILFNGSDLADWAGRPDLWSVADGAIVGRTTADNPLRHNTFLVWQGGRPDDFELTLEFKIESGNSGIQYRSRVLDDEQWIVGGYQADVDYGNRYAGILYEEKGRGILADRGQQVTIDAAGEKSVSAFASSDSLAQHIQPGQWNEFRVVARGNHVQHFINGHKTIDVTDQQSDRAPTAGVIALQLHVGEPMVVRYRNIQLTQL